MAGLFSRLKTWIASEVVTTTDLNAEFDNIIDNFDPDKINDLSADTTAFQVTKDPGEVGTEVLPVNMKEEEQMQRTLIKEITGEAQWYVSPANDLKALNSTIQDAIPVPPNRIISGRNDANNQPTFLVPAGSGNGNGVTLSAAGTDFVTRIDGVLQTNTADIVVSNVTTRNSGNAVATINDPSLDNEEYTRIVGERGTTFIIDNASGSAPSGQPWTDGAGQYNWFQFVSATDSANEFIFGFLSSDRTQISGCFRASGMNDSDVFSTRLRYDDNNDTLNILRTSWVFLDTASALQLTTIPPIYDPVEPSGASNGTFWFDTVNNTWKKHNGSAFVAANAVLIGTTGNDTANTLVARSFDFFAPFNSVNTVTLIKDSVTVIKMETVGNEINVYGKNFIYSQQQKSWDITADLDTGAEASSTTYYLYITDLGDQKLSIQAPTPRHELLGHYHPFKPWRCVGSIFNDSGSDFETATLLTIDMLEMPRISYRDNAGQSGTAFDILNITKVYDTHQLYATGTGIFKVVFPGKYLISANAHIASTAADEANIAIQVNGVSVFLAQTLFTVSTSDSTDISNTVEVAFGDNIRMEFTSANSQTLSTADIDHWINIERIRDNVRDF